MNPIFGWRRMPAPPLRRKDVDAADRQPEQLPLALERKVRPSLTAQLRLQQQRKVEDRRRAELGERIARCVALFGKPTC